jgi:hypothetical protein
MASDCEGDRFGVGVEASGNALHAGGSVTENDPPNRGAGAPERDVLRSQTKTTFLRTARRFIRELFGLDGRATFAVNGRAIVAIYIQVFSLTDHSQPLNGRFKGPYQGINAKLQTSEFSNNEIRVATSTMTPSGEPDRNEIARSRILLAYRHSDTGVLSGTSESLIPIANLPWTNMPGIEIHKVGSAGAVYLKLWAQEMKLRPGVTTRVHFGKTIVYLKNWGEAASVEWTEDVLSMGPSMLHAEPIDQDLTLSAASGSALVVKMGQEAEKS